ncbi:MAG: hypothetical protein ABJ092_00790 [Gillisia sp.]
MKRLTREVFVILFLILLPFTIKAQNNDFEAGLFNVGVGSIIGGMGAVINKKPEEKLGNTILKGLGQGALGGYLVFESKRLVREFAKSGKYGYLWPSKIVNAAGTSVIENAAANRDFWKRWHLNIGFNRFEISTENNLELKYRIMPFALVGTISSLTRGKLNPELSLKTGTLIFDTNIIPNEANSIIYGTVPLYTNSILILNNENGLEALPHEIIHTYQYESFSGINSFLDRPVEFIGTKNRIISLYHKIFYTDYNHILNQGLYYLANPSGTNQLENNFFEKEAIFYGNP